jgi:hypothetical protein
MRVASHAHANPSFTMSMMSVLPLALAGKGRRQKAKNDDRSSASSFVNVGGAERDRTDDLKLAKLALSQLSYSPPISEAAGRARRSLLRKRRLVGPGGVEPPTSRLSGVRSNHLSYEPRFSMKSAVSKAAVSRPLSAGVFRERR